jgi:hypothetical protein
MKKFPVLKVIYYVFAGLIGLVFVWYNFMFGKDIKLSQELSKRVNSNEYIKATSLMALFHNNEENSIISFKAENGLTLNICEGVADNSKFIETSGGKTKAGYLDKAYFGFVQNIGDYQIREFQVQEGENFVDATGNKYEVGKYINYTAFNFNTPNHTYSYRIGYGRTDTSDTLGTDYTTVTNRFASYDTANFLFFVIRESDIKDFNENITSISLIDSHNKEFLKFDTDKLNYNSNFFDSVSKEFLTDYNKAVDEEVSGKVSRDDANKKYDEIYNNYKENHKDSLSDTDEVTKYVTFWNFFKTIIAALIIASLGDLLVGNRLIIKLVMKILHVKPKEKEETSLVMTDYDVNLKVNIVKPEDLEGSVSITFTNINNPTIEFTMDFNDNLGFNQSQRHKNGVYSIALSSKTLKCTNLVDTIELKGFKVDLNLMFEKKEANENE